MQSNVRTIPYRAPRVCVVQTDRQAGRQAGGRADRTDLHCLPASPPQRTHARTHAHQAASSRSPARPPARRRAARVASTSPIPTGPVSQPRPWTGHPQQQQQQQQQQLHHLVDPRHSQDKGSQSISHTINVRVLPGPGPSSTSHRQPTTGTPPRHQLQPWTTVNTTNEVLDIRTHCYLAESQPHNLASVAAVAIAVAAACRCAPPPSPPPLRTTTPARGRAKWKNTACEAAAQGSAAMMRMSGRASCTRHSVLPAPYGAVDGWLPPLALSVRVCAVLLMAIPGPRVTRLALPLPYDSSRSRSNRCRALLQASWPCLRSGRAPGKAPGALPPSTLVVTSGQGRQCAGANHGASRGRLRPPEITVSSFASRHPLLPNGPRRPTLAYDEPVRRTDHGAVAMPVHESPVERACAPVSLSLFPSLARVLHTPPTGHPPGSFEAKLCSCGPHGPSSQVDDFDIDRASSPVTKIRALPVTESSTPVRCVLMACRRPRNAAPFQLGLRVELLQPGAHMRIMLAVLASSSTCPMRNRPPS
ncbi:hypothetical protein Purlil1_5805 [Purpureocillium lilacinum]|uniref:Uncharacterized protein n=1 Tax=Purpureocillium lilacinum TaxID=33203 RepID=A0ABR0C0A3_PURLI|nr:hypothetical protein Purlil1_5805 [Purpureocillium lilacinum]